MELSNRCVSPDPAGANLAREALQIPALAGKVVTRSLNHLAEDSVPPLRPMMNSWHSSVSLPQAPRDPVA